MCDRKLNVKNTMGRGNMGTFCQVYLALAKYHPQSREGVLHCFPEWMLMRACVYVWMLFTPHQTGPAKRCKTGAGSLPNQNDLEECQTLHVPWTQYMHGLLYREKKNCQSILTVAQLSKRAELSPGELLMFQLFNFLQPNTARKIINGHKCECGHNVPIFKFCGFN